MVACFCPIVMGYWLPQAIGAQQLLRGRVTDPSGAGVEGATLELRDGLHIVATTLTTASGHFQINYVNQVEARHIAVRAMGFRPVLINRVDSSPLEFVLQPVAHPLPALLTTRTIQNCKRMGSSKDAMALFDRIRSTYLLASTDVTLDWSARLDSAVVKPEALGSFPNSRMTRRGSRVAPGQRVADSARFDTGEYFERTALPRAPAVDDAPKFEWRYSRIWLWAHDHFLHQSFLKHHVLSAVRLSQLGFTIDFCPRREGRGMSGEMTFSPDSSLSRVLFSYDTGQIGDGMGGEILFLNGVRNSSGRRLAIPMSSAAWRRSPTSRTNFQQWRYEYDLFEFKRCATQRSCSPVIELVPANTGANTH